MQMLSKESIGEDYKNNLSVQDYARKPTIEGVQIINNNVFTDDGGCFVELVRLNDNGTLKLFPDFQVRQSSYSQMMPGVIKTFDPVSTTTPHPSDNGIMGIFNLGL